MKQASPPRTQQTGHAEQPDTGRYAASWMARQCMRSCWTVSWETHVCSAGITTAADMGPLGDPEDAWQTLEQVYRRAARAGELRMRLKAMLPLSTW